MLVKLMHPLLLDASGPSCYYNGMKNQIGLIFLGSGIVIMAVLVGVLAKQMMNASQTSSAIESLISAEGESPEVGVVVSVEGDATARDLEGNTRTLAQNDPVYLNDSLLTSANSRMKVRLIDDSTMAQGANSEVMIESYLFDAINTEDNNCTLRVLKGIFRVFTAKITDTNPDKFHVKTRMATIGIRGCELGFELSEESENVYIFEIGDEEKIVIDADGKKKVFVQTDNVVAGI